MKQKYLIFILIFCSSLASGNTSLKQESEVNLNRWGIDFTFGIQPFISDANRIGVVSPYFATTSKGASFRVSFDYLTRELAEFDASFFAEYSLMLELNSALYKDLVFSFVKLGVGTTVVAPTLYDENILTLPLSLGFHIIAESSAARVISYVVEYRYKLISDFDEKNAIESNGVSVSEKTILSGGLFMGLRASF